MKILVARLDRLGDVLLSLPTLLLLRKSLPHATIDFLCAETFHPLLGPYFRQERLGLLPTLLSGYDAALVLYCDSQTLRALKEHIPLRVGVYSKPLSFFWLTHGRLQRRSRGLCNEAQYNLELAHYLLRLLGEKSMAVVPPIRLPINEKASQSVTQILVKLGVSPHEYVLVHPGMGGSAVNLSPGHYTKIVKRLSLYGPVVLSQGPIDSKMVSSIHQQEPLILKDLNLPELMEAFRLAKVVVAPSTGPLHLAHYVGAKTIGIYSPVRAQRRNRWEPFGGEGSSQILVPDVICPATKHCLGPRCAQYFCMDRIHFTDLPGLSENG